MNNRNFSLVGNFHKTSDWIRMAKNSQTFSFIHYLTLKSHVSTCQYTIKIISLLSFFDPLDWSLKLPGKWINMTELMTICTITNIIPTAILLLDRNYPALRMTKSDTCQLPHQVSFKEKRIIAVMGDGGSGKTCLVKHLLQKDVTKSLQYHNTTIDESHYTMKKMPGKITSHSYDVVICHKTALPFFWVTMPQ